MLGKRSRTLQRTTSTCDIGMASPGVCPSEKPRPSVQVIGFNPKAPFDAVGSSSASPRWDPQCLLTNVHGETASKGSTQAQPVSGGLSSLFRSNVSSVDESNAAARAKTMITKVILVQSKDLGTGKKSQCGPVDLSACKSAANARLPAVDFLDECYLCKQRLVPERDIYMYRGDRAFCSVDCRWQQILLDERTEKCGSAVLNPPPTSPSRRSGHRSGVDGTGTATAA